MEGIRLHEAWNVLFRHWTFLLHPTKWRGFKAVDNLWQSPRGFQMIPRPAVSPSKTFGPNPTAEWCSLSSALLMAFKQALSAHNPLECFAWQMFDGAHDVWEAYFAGYGSCCSFLVNVLRNLKAWYLILLKVDCTVHSRHIVQMLPLQAALVRYQDPLHNVATLHFPEILFPFDCAVHPASANSSPPYGESCLLFVHSTAFTRIKTVTHDKIFVNALQICQSNNGRTTTFIQFKPSN